MTGVKFWSSPKKELKIIGFLAGGSLFWIFYRLEHPSSPFLCHVVDVCYAELDRPFHLLTSLRLQRNTATSAQDSKLIIGDAIISIDGTSTIGMEPKAMVLKIAGVYKTEVLALYASLRESLSCIYRLLE